MENILKLIVSTLPYCDDLSGVFPVSGPHHLHPYIPLTRTPAAYREMRPILEARGAAGRYLAPYSLAKIATSFTPSLVARPRYIPDVLKLNTA